MLVVIQPRVAGWISYRRRSEHGGPWLWLGSSGPACTGLLRRRPGVVLIGLMGVFLDEELQRLNAAKNLLSLLVNFTAAVLFILIAEVDWTRGRADRGRFGDPAASWAPASGGGFRRRFSGG